MAGDPFEDVNQSDARQGRARRPRGGATWLPYVLGILASLATTLLVVVLVLDSTTVKGSLTLEVDQAGATIHLDGKKWSTETPGGLKPIKIPVREGRHEVHVAKGGFVAETREFEIRRDQPNPIIQVRLRPSKKRAN
ncbi:MAG: PEGA domain-containing protein [Gemmataceae bacterium]